jgi:peptidyl-tRNA hydrolase, PTH1 family
MEQWHVVAGLGNPGSQYSRTRHNIGFMVVERLADRWRASWRKESKFKARLARSDRDERKVLLCEPETFMNSSGDAVEPLTRFYQVDRQNTLVVIDDADLPFGTIRLRPEGSSGGHHGLESIQERLGTTQFPRLKLGIGRTDPAVREITDYVLSSFRSEEKELLEKVLTRACDQIECWLTEGILSAMNRFNGIVKSE